MERVLLIIVYVLVAIYIIMKIIQKSAEKKAFIDVQKRIEVGKTVMFLTGLYGVVTNIDKDILEIEIAKGVKIAVNRTTVNTVINK